MLFRSAVSSIERSDSRSRQGQDFGFSVLMDDIRDSGFLFLPIPALRLGETVNVQSFIRPILLESAGGISACGVTNMESFLYRMKILPMEPWFRAAVLNQENGIS